MPKRIMAFDFDDFQQSAICSGQSKGNPLFVKHAEDICSENGILALNEAIQDVADKGMHIPLVREVQKYPEMCKEVGKCFNRVLTFPIEKQVEFLNSLKESLKSLRSEKRRFTGIT